MKTKLLLLTLMFGLTLQAQTYDFTLIQNSAYNYSVAAIPDFTSTAPHPYVNDQNFTILLPEGSSVANATNSYVLAENTSPLLDPFAPGQDSTIFNRVADVVIQGTAGVPIILTTFDVTGTPTSGEINLIPNSHPLVMAAPTTFQTSFIGTLSGSLTDSATENYNTQTGTTIYNFATLGTVDNELTGYSLFPNPAKDVITIKGLENNLKHVEVYNISGQKVMTETLNRIDISQFNSGVYLIKIILQNGNQIVKRFIKQ